MDEQLLQDIKEYCKTYNVPIEYFAEILRDQKVIPMIRGKATEYNAYFYLRNTLDSHIWDVQKLNLNAQNNNGDEDVTITHRATGIRLRVECKNAVRGSFSDGERTHILKVPHFKVKCHRSRSNKSKKENDAYLIGDFDLVISNTSNALYQGNTDDSLELVDNDNLKRILYNYYNVNDDASLVTACDNDWRFVIPEDIAIDGVIPRTPYVALSNDKHWFSIDKIDERLKPIIEKKKREKRRKKK